MFVKDFMTADPITVSPKTTAPETLEIMKQNGLKRLPVLENGRLVGLITEADLMKALPSPATSLSKHEIHYLTSKVLVKDMMSRDIFTAKADDAVEAAVMVMREHDIGCLPVMEGDRLVGIITESNVFAALTELLGLNRPGIRVTVEVPDRIGVLAEITNAIRELDIFIISLATFVQDGHGSIIIRLATDESDQVVQSMEALGFSVSHVVTLSQ